MRFNFSETPFINIQLDYVFDAYSFDTHVRGIVFCVHVFVLVAQVNSVQSELMIHLMIFTIFMIHICIFFHAFLLS